MELEVELEVERAPEAERDYELRHLQAESLERHRAVTWPTFACLLKGFFLFVVSWSVLSNVALGLFSLKHNLPNPRGTWRAMADLTWPLIPTATDWKANVLLMVLAAVVYAGALLRNPKKRRGSAAQREGVRTVSASVQQV